MSGSAIPPRRILVVDDELSVCDAVKMLLEFDGHKVTTVHSAKEALAKFETESFDLLITDFWMPPFNGDELARVIKSKWPHQPIVMITAWPEKLPTPIKEIDMIITKPFLLESLREAIAKTTKNSH